MQDTRTRLLNKAAEEILHHGFQGMRVDIVLDKAGVAKGGLYHHFKNKIELGYAVIDEVILNMIHKLWISPLEQNEDPLEALIIILRNVLDKPTKKVLSTGCPLNNLAQEMSSIDEGFRQRASDIYQQWREAVCAALRRGQDNDIVRKDIQVEKVTTFIVASIAGCIGAAKNARSAPLLIDCTEMLIEYLESLRA